MKLILFIVICCLFCIPSVAGQTNIESINLNGTQHLSLEDSEYRVASEIIIKENASLTIQNSHVILENEEGFNFIVRDNSYLSIINSTIETLGPTSIRLMHESTANVIDSIIRGGDQEEDIIGFGLSENAYLTIHGTNIGYIRQSHNASSLVSECYIGELATRSTGTLTDKMSKVDRFTFFFTDSQVNINRTLHGSPINLRERDLINGTSFYHFNLNNTFIQNPPSIFLEQGFLTINNSEFSDIFIFANSMLDVTNSEIYSINAGDNNILNIVKSNVGELICSNGDFNIKIYESNITALYTYLTTGLNFKVIDSSIDILQLMYAHTYAPQNVEFSKTKINIFNVFPGGPLLYQFSDTEVLKEINLELAEADYLPTTFTGELKFDKNITMNFLSGEGSASVFRVYKIKIMNNGSSLTNTPIYIENNQTILYSGETNDDGEIILNIRFDRILQLIEDPIPDEPYLITQNNFTIPMTAKIYNKSYEFDFLSETPLLIEINDSIGEEITNSGQKKDNALPFSFNLYSLFLTMILIIFIEKKKKK